MKIIWGCYGLICLTSIIIYQKLKKNDKFKQLVSIRNMNAGNSNDKSIWKNFWIVRYESMQIVFAYALQMAIFPAIYYVLTVRKNLKSSHFSRILTYFSQSRSSRRTFG